MGQCARLLLALVTAFALHATAADAQARKPNILVIVGDDMGYADVSAHGCKDIPTPNIDSIARNGIRCTSGYVSGPYCSPTRAGLMTGRYQTRFGHEFNPGGGGAGKNGGLGLPLDQVTLANRLRALGYTTGLVGKWHLGADAQRHPMARGFQEFFGFLGGAHSYLNSKGILRGHDEANEKEYLTDAFRREAVSFIDRHQKEPFFLYLAFNAVHTPLEATKDYRARFAAIPDQKRQTYAAMMSAMDDAVGAVLARLREAGLEENTLVFFFSDNGGPPVNGSNNYPLRGVKATTWEGGIRVPWLVQWKGRLPAGRIYEQPVIQLDIVPTVMAAVGGELKASDKVEGVNLLPYLEGKDAAPPHQALFWRFGAQNAVRMGDWVLVQAKGSAGKQLYNLRDDIGQQKDLTAEQPERVRTLQAAWDAWDKDNVPPLWGKQEQKKKKKG